MSLAILFHFLCAQHVSGINISIIRSLRLFCWITTLVVLFLVRCVLEIRCDWVGVVCVLQPSIVNWIYSMLSTFHNYFFLSFGSSVLQSSCIDITVCPNMIGTFPLPSLPNERDSGRCWCHTPVLNGRSNCVGYWIMNTFIAYVYWTVHRCDNWKKRYQVDVTCYFISLLLCSTCFVH